MNEPAQRFVALDIHKAYLVVGAVDGAKQVVLPPRRVAISQFADWAKRHLYSSDQIVLEATSNAWTVHDLLVPLVTRVLVANAAQVKLIAAARSRPTSATP